MLKLTEQNYKLATENHKMALLIESSDNTTKMCAAKILKKPLTHQI